MIIRPATLADKNVLMAISLSHAEELYPRMKPDIAKIDGLVTEAISTAKHYAWVAERDDGKVRAAVVAFTTDNAWAQRQNSAVMLWVSVIPGAGATLLRGFRDWVLSRRAIRVAGFAPDVELDPRVWKLAERIGFERHGGAYLLYNGGGHGPV